MNFFTSYHYPNHCGTAQNTSSGGVRGGRGRGGGGRNHHQHDFFPTAKAAFTGAYTLRIESPNAVTPIRNQKTEKRQAPIKDIICT